MNLTLWLFALTKIDQLLLLVLIWTSSWLSTFSGLAIRFAISPMRDFSAVLLTGPRKVTRPFRVMIFTFWAFTDMFFPATISLRICAVMAMSALLLPWSRGVIDWPSRSRTFRWV